MFWKCLGNSVDWSKDVGPDETRMLTRRDRAGRQVIEVPRSSDLVILLLPLPVKPTIERERDRDCYCTLCLDRLSVVAGGRQTVSVDELLG